jgi:hypothetical protein
VTSGFVVLGSGNALAQDDEAALEEVVVTGTRITVPGIESSSPIYSVGSDEIDLQAQPEVERILRLLPITKPDDGQNVPKASSTCRRSRPRSSSVSISSPAVLPPSMVPTPSPAP